MKTISHQYLIVYDSTIIIMIIIEIWLVLTQVAEAAI